MRKLIVAISSMAVCVATPAQQLLECVHPDVLNSLVFNALPEAKLLVTREMPDNMAGYRAPTGFTFVGSSSRAEGRSTTVAYRTTLEAPVAFDSLLAFLSGEGWRREVVPPAPQLVAGVAGAQANTAVLCRDGVRRNVMVREGDGLRYATISGSESAPARACGVPAPQPAVGLNPMAAINARQANLPRFSFPETARLSGAQPGGDTYSGSNVFTTSTRIQSPDTGASLARHLARQLAEQGWRSDAQWNGRLSAGSAWTRSSAQGEPLWGTLEILSLGEGTYDVGFTLTTGLQ